MLADGGCAPAEPAPPRTEWEGFEPSRRVNPAHAISSRAPSAARTPLLADPSIARRSVAATSWTPFPLVALFCNRGRLRLKVRSRSFHLAPSASRSRLKLCRGTDAFRGNGTQAEWTKRQAFGHFFFPRQPLRCVCWSRVEGYEDFSRCERFSAFRSACAPSPGAPTVRLAPDAESEADEAPPGCWKSFGTKARRRGGVGDRIAFGATRCPLR